MSSVVYEQKAIESVSVTSSVAVGLTETYSYEYDMAIIVVAGTDINYSCSGTPTSSLGRPAYEGEEITIIGNGNLREFKAISRTASTATLSVLYFKSMGAVEHDI